MPGENITSSCSKMNYRELDEEKNGHKVKQ